jgi:hypothetical protein
MPVFTDQFGGQQHQPLVMPKRDTDPLGTRMIAVGGLVGTLSGLGFGGVVKSLGRQTPMGRVKKLTGFEEHFDHVFIAMPTGASARIGM